VIEGRMPVELRTHCAQLRLRFRHDEEYEIAPHILEPGRASVPRPYPVELLDAALEVTDEHGLGRSRNSESVGDIVGGIALFAELQLHCLLVLRNYADCQ